jgi:hypothetical protein
MENTDRSITEFEAKDFTVTVETDKVSNIMTISAASLSSTYIGELNLSSYLESKDDIELDCRLIKKFIAKKEYTIIKKTDISLEIKIVCPVLICPVSITLLEKSATVRERALNNITEKTSKMIIMISSLNDILRENETSALDNINELPENSDLIEGAISDFESKIKNCSLSICELII